MIGLERGTVELREHRPEWKDLYESEVERLRSIVGDCAFEHIGSTAIEGVAAKPIIDLLAVVPDSGEAKALIPVLEEHGYEYRPNAAGTDRLFFAKGPPTNRTHYLSVTEQGSDFHTEKLAFREHLRRHPDVAAEYEALKRSLAADYPDDRTAYTRRKGPFIETVLQKALRDE